MSHLRDLVGQVLTVCVFVYNYTSFSDNIGEIFLSLYSIFYLCELGGHVFGRCYNSIIWK